MPAPTLGYSLALMKRPSPDSADHGRVEAVATAAAPLNPRAAIAMQGGKLGLLSLTCVVYLVVSGGAYGTEDAVRIAGPRLTLLLCLLVPLTLSVPTALMAAELNALMPVEGGFYFWVKEALGPFWGFAEAYLTLLYTAVDMAIYPVLFSAYLAFLYPLGTGGQLVVGIALVWLAGLLNFLGVRPAGDSAIAADGAAAGAVRGAGRARLRSSRALASAGRPDLRARLRARARRRTHDHNLEFQRMGKRQRGRGRDSRPAPHLPARARDRAADGGARLPAAARRGALGRA